MTRVLIVEDDEDYTRLVKKAIDSQADMVTAGTCTTAEQAASEACAKKPDIVIMDLNLSSNLMDGIEAAKEIHLSATAKVIILTAYENPRIVIEASKRAFASAYIYKSQFSFLIDMIRHTAHGHTPQEQMIFSLIMSDLTIAERSVLENIIGHRIPLFSSEKTIANQKTKILKKLRLKNQKELIYAFLPFRDFL